MRFFCLSASLFVVSTRVNRGAVGSAIPCPPACLPAWLPAFARATIFLCNRQCNRLSCQSDSPPLETIQDSNPINPPSSPVHLNLHAFSKQDLMHELLPSSLTISFPLLPLPSPLSLLGLLSLQRICVEMASALVGSENVQRTIVAMEQADRQAGSSPSLSLACLPDSPALDSFMCSLFWGFRRLNTRHRAEY